VDPYQQYENDSYAGTTTTQANETTINAKNKREVLAAVHRGGHRINRNFAAPASAITVKGGDYDDCLTADDIERMIAPAVPPRGRLSAMDLYLVRVGDKAPQVVRNNIWRKLEAGATCVLAPLHVRYHWTLAVFTKLGPDLQAIVWDSAPSNVTAEDIHTLLRKVGVRYVHIKCAGRQPRGSNECGVHTVVNAWRVFYRAGPHETEGEVSVEHLRRPFAQWAAHPADVSKHARRIVKDPSLGKESGPSGGAPRRPPQNTATQKAAQQLRAPVEQVERLLRDGEEALEARRNRKMKRREPTPDPVETAQPAPVPAATTNAQRPDAQGAIPTRELKKSLMAWKVGERVYAHWTRSPDPERPEDVVVNQYHGEVIAAGRRPLVRFTVFKCQRCGDCRDMPQSAEMRIPQEGATYYEVARRAPPATRRCQCVDVDDEEITEEETAALAQRAVPGAIDHADRLIANTPEGNAPVAAWVPRTNANKTTLRGDAGRCWHVHRDKPDTVHNLVWMSYAPSTREAHRRWIQRIRDMPVHMHSMPFGMAIVELTRQFGIARRWVWSTLASALAAIATALRQLPIYTTELKGLNMKEDVYFTEAMKTAQRMAKTTVGSTDISKGLTLQQYKHLISSSGIHAPHVRLLLMMSWHFAARVGDMRQVRPRDVVLDDPRADGRVPMRITFRYGKVASLWGPYTIHSIVPKDVASVFTVVSATRNNAERGGELFTLREQAALAASVGALNDDSEATGKLTLRSIRRGALLQAAACGVTDDELQLLSGHKRRDTLMRYLGWGQHSSTMHKAAERRAEKTTVAGGSESLPSEHQGPIMGLYSGYTGLKGRRVAQQPEFFPRKPPSSRDCGVEVSPQEIASYTLHIKRTGRVKWEQIRRLARGSPLEDKIVTAQEWCESDRLYGPQYGRDPRHVPAASFTQEQLRAMLDADKIQPFRGEVKGFVKAFTLPQHAKKRLRIIAEPIINQTCAREQMYQVHYPSRLERRARARGAKYSVELDFAAYFDQFDLSPSVRPWFVFRAKEPIDGHEMFALTRLPMGATFAPSVAQAVTSAIVWPLLAIEGVRVDTMIDNIRIVADSKDAFVKAVRLVAKRIRAAGVTLNDGETIEGTDDEIAARHEVNDAPRVFLGEKYVRDTVANADAAVEKLRQAREVFVKAHGNEAIKYTRRNFASFVGLMLFMAHTVDIPLTKCFALLRVYSTVIMQTDGWDSDCRVTSDAGRVNLDWLADALIRNEPVPLPILEQPATTLRNYDVAIEVDASGGAWGAKVIFMNTERVCTLQQKWTQRVGRSAHAEPRAAACAIRWARAQPGYENAKVALISDHVALTTGQRRWYSNFGGFSTSYHLNDFYDALYAQGGGEVFYVEGEHNEADALSRDVTATYTLKVSDSQTTFRDLSTVKHPHLCIPRSAFQV
jgi:hypothetical protein